jgi:hypothetical protein
VPQNAAAGKTAGVLVPQNAAAGKAAGVLVAQKTPNDCGIAQNNCRILHHLI